MGSRIAAQLANANIPSLLLDLDRRDRANGLDAALKGRPGAFFVPERRATDHYRQLRRRSRRRSRTATGSSKLLPKIWRSNGRSTTG